MRMLIAGVRMVPMARAAKPTVADWKDDFLFVGNQPALDLVNTGLVMRGEPVELIADFAALVRWFQAAGLLGRDQARRLEQRWARSPEGARLVAFVRRLREMLRAEILRREAGRSIRPEVFETLNRLLAEHPMRSRLGKREGAPSIESYFEPERPDDLLAPLAYAVARLFAELPSDRVRKCASCVAQFYDSSKKGNRRWCSMQICGNREKVAAYAARQRRVARRPSYRRLETV
jgi:predicted RNA-binding Zn ribbon-like protein